eukprot:CAMPEP_0116090156 /NCGR_PEP_ID=MMETSP0327-20121206/6804_1 /TAXON_ID=44447 /ORGANISM="Pseudo-nitzschia delicatissima, Strain B596" /LENGTH=317 /DNA_ID=CAMNT_0003581387 /DNA_START=253 /DNA_END=1206 /DNA_ORIENTATION=+
MEVKFIFAGTILVCVAYNIWITSLIDVKPYDVSHKDSNDVDIEKLKRFSKYYQTYRYVGPASRYDHVKVPADECGDYPNFAAFWKLDKHHRSRLNEDKFIYGKFFQNLASGFKGTYLELGAYNGVQESNSRFFDICLGWEGLLIEGNPENYQQTLANRQYAHRMSLAPSCSAEYESINKTIPFYRYPITNVGLVGYAESYEGKPTVDVPCAPLQPILEDIFVDHLTENLPTVDFFSLDVEGAEALVLETIDFQAVRINLLMIEIENNHCADDDCPVRKQVRAKMESEGYKRYEREIPHSDLYVHPKSPYRMPKTIWD